jgi:hypothetical protein
MGKEEDSCPICGGNIKYIANERARKYIKYYKTGRRIEARF